MTANVNIIKIGNSLGIILPSKVLRKLGAKERDKLELNAMDGRVVLTSNVSSKNPFSAISKGGFYDSDIDPHAFSEMLRETRGKAKPIEDILP